MLGNTTVRTIETSTVSRVDTKNNAPDLFTKHLDGLRTVACEEASAEE